MHKFIAKAALALGAVALTLAFTAPVAVADSSLVSMKNCPNGDW